MKNGTNASFDPRVRLLKVSIQPTFVYDDGQALTEFNGAPVVVPSGSWNTFSSRSFTQEDLELIKKEYESQLDEYRKTQ